MFDDILGPPVTSVHCSLSWDLEQAGGQGGVRRGCLGGCWEEIEEEGRQAFRAVGGCHCPQWGYGCWVFITYKVLHGPMHTQGFAYSGD